MGSSEEGVGEGGEEKDEGEEYSGISSFGCIDNS